MEGFYTQVISLDPRFHSTNGFADPVLLLAHPKGQPPTPSVVLDGGCRRIESIEVRIECSLTSLQS